MGRFLAGMATMLVLVVVGLVGLLASAESPTSVPTAAPLGPGVRPSAAPADLAPCETWLAEVDLSANSLVLPDGPLQQVTAHGTNVRVAADGLRVGDVKVDAVLPFEVAARQVAPDVVLYDAGGGRAGVRRTQHVLGVDLNIRATGTVHAENGQLLILPESVDVGLPGVVNDALSEAARRLVTIRQPVEGLPPGLRLTSVSVAPEGFRASLRGQDVRIAGS